ncbi:uncharacterized protein V6R79_007006 [Siganus canaliculatus]
MVGLVLVLFLSWGLVDSNPVERQLICSQQPITALAGDDVILPCHLQPPVSAADWTVEWSKPGLNPESVHYHENGRVKFEEQNPSYSFRTKLFVDDMKTGNVSVKIFDVEKSDSGIYKCFLPSIKKEASIELIVVERHFVCSQQPITALFGDDVILPCHLDPPVSAADWTVEWSKPGLDPESVHYHEDGRLRVKEQNPSYSHRTSLSVDDMKTGDVSLRIFDLKKSDSGIYKCFLHSTKKEASIELIVVERHLNCSQQPITALVGDDVILPCHLEPPVSAADWTVQWSKPGLDPESVHYHEDGRAKFEEQNPSYSFRTSLFVDDMKTGNVSIKLYDLKKSDSGIYKCFLPSIKKEASVELIVVERRLTCSQQPITALDGDDVILPCHLEPPVSAADWTVEWSKPGLNPESVHYHEEGGLRVKEQNPSYSYRTRLFVDDMKTGNVSMKIFDVEKSDSGIYKCFLPSIKTEASIELIVAKAKAEEEARAREEAEDKAREAENKAKEAENKAKAEAKARQEAKAKAEEEARAREEAKNRATNAERRATEAENKASEETKARVEAKAKASEEARARQEAEDKAREAENKASEETKARVEAKARATYAERRAIEEARARVEAEDRAINAERRAIEEARARVEAEDRAINAERRAIEAENKAIEETKARVEAKARATYAKRRATEETSMCFE